MGRSHQADACAQVVRAKPRTLLANHSDHRPAARNAAPLGNVRLQHAKGLAVQCLHKAGLTHQVLTGGQGHTGVRAQVLPVGQAAVGAQRFLQPGQTKGRQARQHGQRVGQVPSLVYVGHQRRLGAQPVAQRCQVGNVLCIVETYLQLESAVALGVFALHHPQCTIRVDAAGVQRYPGLLAAEQAEQRQSGTVRAQVPQRQINARDHLRHRAGLAALQCQYFGLARGVGKGLGRVSKVLVEQQGRHHGVQQAGTVFGATGWEIAPDLAPTDRAVGRFGPHEDRRAIMHGAKRGTHRHRAGATQHKGL